MFKVIQKRTGRTAYIEPDQKQIRQRQIFLFAMFLSGLILGSLTVRQGENIIFDRLYLLIRNYIEVKQTQSVWINFNNVLLKRVLTLVLLYCIGVCALGAPILYLAPAVHGTGIGVISAYLYSAFSLKGIGYCALLLYPGEILFTAVMIFGCTISIEMAGKLLHSMRPPQDLPEISLQRYSVRYGVLFLLCAVSAVLETAMFTIFSGYFQFS